MKQVSFASRKPTGAMKKIKVKILNCDAAECPERNHIAQCNDLEAVSFTRRYSTSE